MLRELDEAVRQILVVHVSDVIASCSQLLRIFESDVAKRVVAVVDEDSLGQIADVLGTVGRDVGLRIIDALRDEAPGEQQDPAVSR